MRFRPTVSVFCVVAFALCLGGCAKREIPVEEGIRTRTLLVGNQNEPATLDPHVVNAYTDQIILVALFEGLTVLDEKTAQARPGVAESWQASPDGLTWTFALRADARWSNGDAVTARDFAYSFHRLLSPAFAGEYSFMLWPIKNAERYNKGELKNFSDVGVEVINDRTLRLRLENPTAYLPALAAHPTWMPVHRATLEKHGRADDRGNPWTRPGTLIGNGPFTLTEWKPNARIVTTKNPRYWDAAHTWLERVVFFPIEQADTEDRNFRAGQLHLTYDVPKAKAATYRTQSPSPLRIDPLLNITYLNFNTKKPPFTDPRVRRALALALDREAISSRVLNGTYPPAFAMTPPNCGGYSPVNRVPTDYAAARRLLAEAGFPGGKGFPAVAVQVLNDEAHPRMMEAIQAMWQRELGIRVTIEPYEQKTWLQNQQTMAHTLATLGWTADFPDPVTFLDVFRTGNGQNWTGWGDKAYDTLLDQAAGTIDPAARFEKFQQAEALLLDAAPVAPLVHRARTYLLHPTVKNWEPSPLGFHRFQLVRLEK
ncbi:MAG: peptide ABC transporter substrate-binding protein [Verrucomicrobia bacterium]|nr:peptide ABC transporter substrate-binding protein [Verrucomicrobiota bacterium]